MFHSDPHRQSPIHHEENMMNKDQVKGRVKEATGKAKEVAGKAFSKELENKGKVENARGKVQSAYGDLKEDVKDAFKATGHRGSLPLR
jgi:uncharacterized protein YjbJ (UPF0337 family)